MSDKTVSESCGILVESAVVELQVSFLIASSLEKKNHLPSLLLRFSSVQMAAEEALIPNTGEDSSSK